MRQHENEVLKFFCSPAVPEEVKQWFMWKFAFYLGSRQFEKDFGVSLGVIFLLSSSPLLKLIPTNINVSVEALFWIVAALFAAYCLSWLLVGFERSLYYAGWFNWLAAVFIWVVVLLDIGRFSWPLRLLSVYLEFGITYLMFILLGVNYVLFAKRKLGALIGRMRAGRVLY